MGPAATIRRLLRQNSDYRTTAERRSGGAAAARSGGAIRARARVLRSVGGQPERVSLSGGAEAGGGLSAFWAEAADGSGAV